MRVAGVDEAGRGCVIGPLIIAGVVFEEASIPILHEMGVTDSKRLSPSKRAILAEKIRKLALDINIVEIEPKTIDHVVFRNKPLRRLNYLETMVMAKIIRDLRPDIVYVDTPDVNSERCINQIKSVINFRVDVVCEPRADLNHISTGAASILAKERREERIKELRAEYGDFNSGYTSDRKTQEFIANYFSLYKECPSYMRASWATVQKYIKPVKQMKLTALHDPSQRDQE